MRYLLLRLEVTGKRPVWSVETLPVSYTVLTKTWWDRPGRSCCLVMTIADGAIEGLVGHMFCRFCLRCSFALASDLGRCLRTSSEVRPGQVAKYPASMDLVQVWTTRLKSHRCRYWLSSAFVFISYALQAKGWSSGGATGGGWGRSI